VEGVLDVAKVYNVNDEQVDFAQFVLPQVY